MLSVKHILSVDTSHTTRDRLRVNHQQHKLFGKTIPSWKMCSVGLRLGESHLYLFFQPINEAFKQKCIITRPVDVGQVCQQVVNFDDESNMSKQSTIFIQCEQGTFRLVYTRFLFANQPLPALRDLGVVFFVGRPAIIQYPK